MFLADYLEILDRSGELLRVAAEVDPDLELAAVSGRLAREDGRAIFFERVKGQRPPVVTNLFGRQSRICQALGVQRIEEMVDRMMLALGPREAEGWLDKIRPLERPGFAPRTVKSGLCQQVVKLGRDVDLGELPALRCWPLEQQRSITAGIVFSRDPETHARALESIPLVVLERDRLGIAWHVYQDAFRHQQSTSARGERMPVAVVLGGDPRYRLVAGTLPSAIDRLQFVGLLCGKPVELVKCRTHDLEVPTDAEVVIEGFIEPQAGRVDVGPLAGSSGHYRLPGQAPMMHVTAVTQRTNPVWPAIVLGQPPHELTCIDKALERLLLPLVRQAVPELVDYDLPETGGWQNFAFVSIRKTVPHQARKVAAALWGLEQTMFAKFLAIVDEGVDVHDYRQVLTALGTNVDPGRDVFFHQGPGWPLDHAAATPLTGHALGIDATAKQPAEHPRPWPARLATSEDVERLVASRWGEYGGSG
jgi:4-hydroxy-3-polyprenylbenzoate decarboxylase